MPTDEESSPVLAVIEMRARPTQIDALYEYLAEILPGTRSFAGCKKVEIFADPEDRAHLLFHVTWVNLDQQLKYVGWREETGVSAKLGSFLVRQIDLTNWSLVEI